MKIEIKNKCIISDVSEELAKEIKSRLTLDNPKYSDAVKQGYRPSKISATLEFYRDVAKDGSVFETPAGFINQLISIAKNSGVEPEITDKRIVLEPVDFEFHGELRPMQQPACTAVLKENFGILHAPTGSGKTAMALWLMARRRQPALVVVHTRELLNQWLTSIDQFLKIELNEIGIIGDGKFKIGKRITIAMIQTLVKRAEEAAPYIGYLILDECHRAPAMQCVKAINEFDCKYRTGLTATPFRRDKLSKVIFWHMGDIKGKIEKSDLLESGSLCQAEVIWINTRFNTDIDASANYSKALSALTEDHDRNRLVCDAVANHKGNGVSLILSDRRDHCKELARILSLNNNIDAEVLTGAVGNKERKKIINDLSSGRCRYLVATGQLVGEGFDLPEISILFMTCPVKFPGRVIQYIGRILRPLPGKEKALIIDFVDKENPVFTASARSRFYTYKSQGIVKQVVE
ncbi:MAG: DEAD/DEAH box helicase [Thermodesulfobacteriota bacterium]|nr:DEAD/DEAH box helicase [Thermodesulfobacteriota bacterium]